MNNADYRHGSLCFYSSYCKKSESLSYRNFDERSRSAENIESHSHTRRRITMLSIARSAVTLTRVTDVITSMYALPRRSNKINLVCFIIPNIFKSLLWHPQKCCTLVLDCLYRQSSPACILLMRSESKNSIEILLFR